MSDFSQICAAIMAAGQSSRFGKQDKLVANLHGKKLGHHISDTLSTFAFKKAITITSKHNHPCEKGWLEDGFETVKNDRAQDGLGTSIALAARIAMDNRAGGLLICLGDMPFIPREHFEQMTDSFVSQKHSGVVASAGDTISPPVIFGAEYFADLARLDEDQGARSLMKNATTIELDSALLVDIDRPETLIKLANNQNEQR